jgi:nucleotide sugar dehydrogenase
MTIAIIGTGYVGLVTGACFAEVGHTVVCVDSDANKVALLQAGGIPIYEPGLEELVKKNVQAGRLSFTQSTAEGIASSQVIFIAVPTPPQPDGSVDMSFIEGVAREIAASLESYRIIVDKSTVPVKTGEKVAETIKRYCRSGIAFDVVSNPEFLREGFAVDDLMKPDRVVVGVSSQRPVAAMKEIYAPFGAPIIVTDTNSAELIKHAAKLVPRTQDFLRQRACRHLRSRRRQRPGSHPRHGTRFPHWPAIPPGRTRLRRIVLPQRISRPSSAFPHNSDTISDSCAKCSRSMRIKWSAS